MDQDRIKSLQQYNNMKFQDYFLCSHHSCIHNHTFLFSKDNLHEHVNHEIASAQLDDIHQAYKKMVENRHQACLEASRKQIILHLQKLVLKLFDKSSLCLEILKNQSFAPKSPLSFTYQQIKGFPSNKQLLQQSVQTIYQHIDSQYKHIFQNWQQQLCRLQQFIDSSIINHQISPQIKKQPSSQHQIIQFHQPLRDEQHMSKTKKIKKMKNKIKQLMQAKLMKNANSEQKEYEQSQPNIESQQVLQLSQQGQTSSIYQAFKLKSIIINSSKIKQYKVNQLLKQTSSIKQIEFNVNYKINRYFYVKCTQKVASQLTHLYQLWNQSTKFKQRQSCIYFPQYHFNENIVERYHFQFALWKKFPQLKTLWIANKNDFTNARYTNFYKSLEYLNIQPCACCPSGHLKGTEVLNRFGSSNKLKALILRNIPHQQQLTQAIIRCFNLNKQISLFIMNSCKIQQGLINRVCYANITNLCLKSNCAYGSQILDILPIFKLQQLKYLSLVNIIFSQQRKQAHHIIPYFSNLSKLIYINLYHAYPVFSQLLDNLHENLAQSLVTLNLGLTHVDNECINRVLKFQNLLELNLDETQIQIEEISKICLQPCLKLKSISLSGCNGQTVRQLECIAQRNKSTISSITLNHLHNVYPNLSYLNINNKNVSLFNWGIMKSLQMVAIEQGKLSKKYLKSLGIQIFQI